MANLVFEDSFFFLFQYHVCRKVGIWMTIGHVKYMICARNWEDLLNSDSTSLIIVS